MRHLNSKLFFYTLILILAGSFFSCTKNPYVSVGNITGPRSVHFAAQGVEYSILANSSVEYTLWKVPSLAQIVSGQGTNVIKVNFGKNPGNICVSLYSKGSEMSVDTCLDVNFVDDTNKWNREPDFKGGHRSGAVGFSIGDKGYVGTGINDFSLYKDFWEYDPILIVWTQKADFGGVERCGAVGFSIGSKGYIGTGNKGIGSSTSDYLKDFWEYDPSSNQWFQKTDCSNTARQFAVGFSIGTKGYIGAGKSAVGIQSDFWEYNPTSNQWFQKADLVPRASAVAFSIAGKGYYGFGATDSTNFYKDFYQYNPVSNTWTQKAGITGWARAGAIGFSINNLGYVGTGYKLGGGLLKDIWVYKPGLNTWEQQTYDFVGESRSFAVGFSIGNKACVGTGNNGTQKSLSDFWVFPQ